MLRPIELSDLDDLVALGSDPDVTRFVGNLDRPSAEERIRLAEGEWSEPGYGMMAILERAGQRFPGRGGLKYWTQFGETEVGWVLRRDTWGHGYAAEAGRARVEWGLANFALPYSRR
jgi:RimJ/RimL family protein N-acetyltransferase